MKVECLLLGGENYEIGGILFELHPYCGPTPVHKKTLQPLEREPAPIFWALIERWELGGKQTVDNGSKYPQCVVPEWCDMCRRTGMKLTHLSGRNFEASGDCENCKGNKVIF